MWISAFTVCIGGQPRCPPSCRIEWGDDTIDPALVLNARGLGGRADGDVGHGEILATDYTDWTDWGKTEEEFGKIRVISEIRGCLLADDAAPLEGGGAEVDQECQAQAGGGDVVVGLGFMSRMEV